tara:strand:- start:10835 stop:12496 length:1662 start_codon:yes stop_codon:yes gene_type:complete
MAIDFLLPIEYRCPRRLSKELQTDLHMLDGDSPLAQTIYKPKSSADQIHFGKYSEMFTTDVRYLRETQRILAGELPDSGWETWTEPSIVTLEGNSLRDFLSKYGYFSFQGLSALNTCVPLLAFLSIYGIVAPVLAFLVPLLILLLPFLMLKAKGQRITLDTYIPLLRAFLRKNALSGIFDLGSASWERRGQIMFSLCFYFFQLYINAENCREHINNLSALHSEVSSIKEFVSATQTRLKYILKEWKDYKTYKAFLQTANEADKKCTVLLRTLDKVLPYKASLSKIVNLGECMKTWYQLNTDPSTIAILNYCVGFNAYMNNMACLKTSIRQNEMGKSKYGSTTKIRGLWHPSLNCHESVKNDLELSTNIILTGPNAAGKTTLIKSVLLNSVLAQQIGYGFFANGKFKIYGQFHSYINIPDTNGRDSLFQAEASRCKLILDSLERDKISSHLCVFDELFSGTNPKEATAAATAFLEHIGHNKRVSFVLTTHYKGLIHMRGRARNLQMLVKTENDVMLPEYKVVEGVSNVDGGIIVLKDKGFPEEIIDRAREYIRG